MREVTPENAAEYLRETGRVPPGRAVEAKALGWGVSNVVIRVEVEGEPPFVLKQARERLRTEGPLGQPARPDLERARGAGAARGGPARGDGPRRPLRRRGELPLRDDLRPGRLGRLEGATPRRRGRPGRRPRAGELLATVHAATRDHPALAGRLADTTVFDELRVDPFYRAIARVHPEIAPQIEALIASMSRTDHRCFVHADFSPKNILVHSQGLTLVDFETAHAGDPAFDLGFFLSHLSLKGLRGRRRSRDDGPDPRVPLRVSAKPAA